jgi:hypothetical protein
MITGTYVVKSDGKVIGEYKNFITANGLYVINQFLAGQGRDWGGTIAIGTLNTVATASSTTNLQFEIARFPVILKSYSSSGAFNRQILKATIDPAAAFNAYEIGVFPNRVDIETYLDNYKITNFSETTSGSSNWLYANNSSVTLTSSSPSPRSGVYMVNLPVTTTTTTNTTYLTGLTLDSGPFTEVDNVQLSYYTFSAVPSASISVIFGDSSTPQNTWSSSTASVSSLTASTFYSSSLVMQTKPSTIVDPIINASVTFYGSSGSVALDHMKFVSGASLTNDFQLVSRTISSTTASPLFSKNYSQPMDIEYYIQVT